MRPATRSLASVAFAALLAAACVDSPTAFGARADQAGDPLALTFDELARQATNVGDSPRAMGFTLAAVAIRNGVTPGRLDVRNAGTLETYDAFVHAVAWQLGPGVPAIIPDHRAITAWRRTGDGVTRILALTTQADSAVIVSPLAPVAAGVPVATAWYEETTSLVVPSTTSAANGAPTADLFWAGTSGYVRVRESVAGGACPATAESGRIRGVTCNQAKYVVRFEGLLFPLATRPAGFVAGGAARRLQAATADQVVNGYRFTIACPAPTASRGCG